MLVMSRDRRGVIVVSAAIALLYGSCGMSDQADEERLGTLTQALVDTDSDGMDDDWEILHFGNLSRTGTGDFDSDGLTDREEYISNFNPTVMDALDDADG